MHGIEASSLSLGLLRRLRSAFVSAVWSGRMPLAHVDGPVGCDPGFYIVRCWFRLHRRYLAYRPLEIPRLYSLLDLVSAGCPGHGPVHLLVQSAGVLGFAWDPGGGVGFDLVFHF